MRVKVCDCNGTTTDQHRRFEVITTERELKSEVESAGHAYRKVVRADKVNYYADDKWLGSRFVGGCRDRLIEALNRAASRI